MSSNWVTAQVAKQKQVQKQLTLGTGKINVKIIKSRGKEYRQRWIYIPAKLVDSGKFPFKDDEQVVFVIDEKNNRVVIQKLTPQPL